MGRNGIRLELGKTFGSLTVLNEAGRGLCFNLTEEQFRTLTDMNCSYCGALPANVKETPGGYFIYNGIDRKDNSKGYEFENCIPCCFRCNEMKMDRTAEEFIEVCTAIACHNARA